MSVCSVLECTKEIITKNINIFILYISSLRTIYFAKYKCSRFFIFKIYPADGFAQVPLGSLYCYNYTMEQHLFSIVKHTELYHSLLNLFRVMLIERKIRYEDKTNTAYKYVRINYERNKPSTTRWARHVARMGEERGVYRVLLGKPEGKNH